MGQPAAAARPVRAIAAELDEVAAELFLARHDPRDPSVFHNARIDAVRAIERLARELRQ